jgi:hypothetical protein
MPATGDIVLLPFSYSDLTLKPAILQRALQALCDKVGLSR